VIPLDKPDEEVHELRETRLAAVDGRVLPDGGRRRTAADSGGLNRALATCAL